MIESGVPAREDSASFASQWASAPGETVLDIASERGWARRELADRLGLSVRHLDLFVAGQLPLTEAMAERLHSVLGAPAQFWLRREDQFRERQKALGKDRSRGMAFLQVEFAAAVAEGDEGLANDLLALVFSKCAVTALELVDRHGMLIAGEHRLLSVCSGRRDGATGNSDLRHPREQQERQNG